MWKYNYSDELYHHGIMGMKWGKKNGPPYPLNAGSHSAAEKKAGTKGWTKEAKADAIKKAAVAGTVAAVGVGSAGLGYASYRTKKAFDDGVKNMSDDDLKRANTRSALEGNYKKNHNPESSDNADLAWKISENTKNTANAMKNIGRTLENNSKKTIRTENRDISKLSDQELQRIVNRMNLENNYKRLTTVEVTDEGAAHVRQVLDAAGDISITAAGATLLALNIANAVKHLKGF